MRRGTLLDKEQIEFFQRHRRSQRRDRQSQETASEETPGGAIPILRGALRWLFVSFFGSSD